MATQLFTPSHASGYHLVDWQRPINSNYGPTKGLLAFWLPHYDLTGGTKLYDIAGRGYHGDITGAAWSTSTPSNARSILYGGDASGDYVTVTGESGTGSAWNLTGEFTFWCWCRHTSTVWNTVIGKRSAAAGYQYHFRIASGTNLVSLLTTGGSINATTSVPTNTWNWIGVTRGPSATRLYLNGVDDGGGTNKSITYKSVDVAIGSQADDDNNFNGKIGDLAAYNRALSADEMYACYEDSRRGYPNFLNRRPIPYFIPAAAGSRRIFIIG